MTDKNAENILANIKKHGITAQGRRELIKHLEGGKNHRSAALKAKCYDCCGYYGDGKVDCGIPECPLHPYMPFRGKDAGA